MAFVFKSIEQQLQNPQQQQQQSNDIFGQPNAMQGQGGPVQLSSTSGQQTSSSGGGASVANQNQVKQENQPASNASLFNQIKQKNTVDAGNVGYVKTATQSANDIQGNLQAEANKIAGAAPKPLQASDEDISGAINQGGEAFSKVKSALNQKYVPIKNVDLNVDTKIKNLPELQDDAQRRALAQKEYGPQYTTGMSSLDDALLRRNPGFQNILSGLKNTQTTLDATKAGKQAELTSAANKTMEEGIPAEQKRINGILQGKAESLKSHLRDESSAAAAKVLAEKEADRKQVDDYITGVKQKAAEAARGKELDRLRNKYDSGTSIDGRPIVNIQQSNPEWNKWQSDIADVKNKPWQQYAPDDFGVGSIDSKYMGDYRTSPSIAETITPEESTQFNNIMGLLNDPTQLNPTAAYQNHGSDMGQIKSIGDKYLKDKWGI